MATVYLHIGTMKTGSTAIQSFLDDNRMALAQKGCCYPKLEMNTQRRYTVRNAHFLVESSAYVGNEGATEKKRELHSAGFHELRILAEKFERIILTDEVIWNRCNRKEFWEELICDLKNIGCDLKVILYLRRQDEVVQSLWMQFVKRRGLLADSFSDWIRERKYGFFHLDYYSHLKKLEQVLTKDRMIVRVYEDCQYEGNSHTIQSDFLHAVGLEMTDEFLNVDQVRNYSLGGNYLEIKRLINGLPDYRELGDIWSDEIRRANDYWGQREKRQRYSLFLPGEQRAFLMEYEQSNKMVAAEFLGRKNSSLFLNPYRELPHYAVDQSEMYRDLLSCLIGVCCRQEKQIRELGEKLQKFLNGSGKGAETSTGRQAGKIKNAYRRIQNLTRNLH